MHLALDEPRVMGKLHMAWRIAACIALFVGLESAGAQEGGGHQSFGGSGYSPGPEGSIVVGSEPIALAISSDGARLYVVNRDDFTVSVVTTAKREVSATIPVGPSPRSLLVTPDNQRLYVINFAATPVGGNSVTAVATENNSVLATIQAGVA